MGQNRGGAKRHTNLPDIAYNYHGSGIPEDPAFYGDYRRKRYPEDASSIRVLVYEFTSFEGEFRFCPFEFTISL